MMATQHNNFYNPWLMPSIPVDVPLSSQTHLQKPKKKSLPTPVTQYEYSANNNGSSSAGFVSLKQDALWLPTAVNRPHMYDIPASQLKRGLDYQQQPQPQPQQPQPPHIPPQALPTQQPQWQMPPKRLSVPNALEMNQLAEHFVQLNPNAPQRWTAPGPVIVATSLSANSLSQPTTPLSSPSLARSSAKPSKRQATPGGDIEQELTGQNLYKTELCRSFEETGTCRYGLKCQFAHGRDELRPVLRHPKYKTEICKTFHTIGTCPYGKRCRFIHSTPDEADCVNQPLDRKSWSKTWKTQQQQDAANASALIRDGGTLPKPGRPSGPHSFNNSVQFQQNPYGYYQPSGAWTMVPQHPSEDETSGSSSEDEVDAATSSVDSSLNSGSGSCCEQTEPEHNSFDERRMSGKLEVFELFKQNSDEESH